MAAETASVLEPIEWHTGRKGGHSGCWTAGNQIWERFLENGVAVQPDPSDLPEIPIAGDLSPCAQHGCSRCCHDVEMLLTEADVARIGAAHPDVDFWFQADDDYLQLRVADRPPVAGQRIAPGAAGKPCVFLDEGGRCSIHEIRPAGCRLYPAVFDDPVPRAILDDEYCPHTDGFTLDGEVHQAVQALAETLNRERDARVEYRR